MRINIIPIREFIIPIRSNSSNSFPYSKHELYQFVFNDNFM